MNDRKLSDRERALLDAARREVAAGKGRRETTATPPPGRPAAPRAGDARSARPVRASPLDAPTVVGWDHPAAHGARPRDEDKWAKVAALMEAERAEANANRRRMRQFTIAFVGVALVLVLLAVARMLLR